MKIRLKGIEPVVDMLRRAETVPERVDRLKRDFAFGTHGNIIQRTVVGRKNGGNLRASNAAPNIFGATIEFINTAHYAPYVEFGTGRRGAAGFKSILPPVERGIAYALYWPGMDAMPFMRPAIKEGIDELERKLSDLGSEVAG